MSKQTPQLKDVEVNIILVVLLIFLSVKMIGREYLKTNWNHSNALDVSIDWRKVNLFICISVWIGMNWKEHKSSKSKLTSFTYMMYVVQLKYLKAFIFHSLPQLIHKSISWSLISKPLGDTPVKIETLCIQSVLQIILYE